MKFDVPLFMHMQDLTIADNGTEITLAWSDYSSVTIDPVTQSRIGTPVAKSEVVTGLLHFVAPVNKTQVRQHTEVEVGDCLVDLPADVELDGREGLTFTFNKATWVLAEIGDKLTTSWDQVMHGERLYRTVLLRKK